MFLKRTENGWSFVRCASTRDQLASSPPHSQGSSYLTRTVLGGKITWQTWRERLKNARPQKVCLLAATQFSALCPSQLSGGVLEQSVCMGLWLILIVYFILFFLVTSVRHTANMSMRQSWFLPQLCERSLDGEPASSAFRIKEYIDRFSGRWTGRGSKTVLPPRSPETCPAAPKRRISSYEWLVEWPSTVDVEDDTQ